MNHRIEIIINIHTLEILRIRFLDDLASIYRVNTSLSNDFEKYKLVEEYLMTKFPPLATAQQKQVLYRNVLAFDEFMLYYENKMETYVIKAIVTNGGTVKIYEFRTFNHPKSKKVFSYQGIEGNPVEDIDIEAQTKSFRIAQNKLFRDYGHFLSQPQLK